MFVVFNKQTYKLADEAEANSMDEEEKREALLRRGVYFENCPGCKLDEKKDANVGHPYKEYFYVWTVCLCAGLPIASLFPFLYFMIRDLHIAERVEDIGFYAGFVGKIHVSYVKGASFMFGRALTSVVWGVIADRWGRKPVIIIGLISLIIFNTLFGLSVNYWMAIATRFLLGALNGILGPIKAYAVEICRPEQQSIALSLVSTAWGIGLVIGPAVGGFLALETVHNHPGYKTANGTIEPLEPSPHDSDMREKDVEGEGRAQPNTENLLTNWPLMSSIIVYCVFSLHDTAYTEIFSLWAESDRKFGGLSFSSEDVGEVLSISGFSLLVFQLFLYPPAERLLGPINLCRVAAAISIPLLAMYPFMPKLSGVVLSVVVNCASLLKNVLSTIIITGMFMLQNNVVSQRQRGAANGIAMTGMSISKAIAPAGAGVIFSWAQKRQYSPFLPGDQMVFFILITTELIGLIMTFKPFLAIK
ncbi:protein ZINC INDUCED FACILITATOR-LIKE 1-like isoform X2 [Asparagus officinalis]|uniref:protein ZINC INDUCED FACILITATOR-LIKE 1-like isoform X2 n=1 Tax=Asparagus officinalis TaxID=4686 RepID=UPI00098E19BF|nr:protein ZINC INDUCED FACILITATOR-LIKE 1-like isoform X2 [Asparagus officinalis]